MNSEAILSQIKKIFPRQVLDAIRTPYHFCMSFWAALFYGFPSRNLFVIGVTGTKGKTTVVRLLDHVLREGGVRVASLSSLGTQIDGRETVHPLKMTMPGRMAVQRFLHQARRSKCEYAVIEVTSEGIKQFRHRFIHFRAALFTGIHPEHIESHGSYEKYLRAKLDLFWRLPKEGIAVIPDDDAQSMRVAASTRAKKVFYAPSSIRMGDAVLPVRHVSIEDDGIECDVGNVSVRSHLLGTFNLSNILAVFSFVHARHLSLEKAAAAVETFSGIPGRMEYLSRSPFSVVVDYAHTPDSLEEVYRFIKEQSATKDTPRRLICVLGAAGGGRDRWKRPEFGKVASHYCNLIFLTNEDPYDEDPEGILRDIRSGVEPPAIVESIIDRREAIHRALESARAGDTVVITGKGAEKWIAEKGGVYTPWDERAIVKEEFEKKNGRGISSS